MTTRITRAAFLASLVSSAAKGNWPRAESLLNEAAKRGKPKSAVLAVRDGGNTWSKAFGEATEHSRFLIASITKPMTAAGLMWLADRRKFALDEPIRRYLPERPEPGITIRHLLTHTSGLPDMLPENTELRRRNAPLEEYVRLSLSTPLAFEPGTCWSYSSTGILLAAEIARRIYGHPIGKLLAEQVYAPLGMTRTVLGLGDLKLTDVVRSQTEYAPADLGGAANDAGNWDWNSLYWRSLGAPWGGAHSTAADVLTFVDSFARPSGKPLAKSTAARMIANQNSTGLQPYGLGWRLGSALGSGLSDTAFGHGGSTGTLCWHDPTKKRSFVLLTSLPDNLARQEVIQPVSRVIAG
jgi:CubicO group peptidase (beta-lactamase class C family)